MDEDKEKKEESSNYSKGYGKRPLWQWILIYAVVGIIIYGLIYYFFIARGTSTIQVPGY